MSDLEIDARIKRLDRLLDRVWKRHGHSARFEKLLQYQESLLEPIVKKKLEGLGVR